MKKILLLALPIFLLVIMSGCSKKEPQKHQLVCSYQGSTFKYVYTDKDLVEYDFNDTKFTSGDTFDLATQAVKVAGGIDKYISNAEINLEQSGFTCNTTDVN